MIPNVNVMSVPVMEGLDLLIGQDFLKSCHAVLDYGRMQCTLSSADQSEVLPAVTAVVYGPDDTQPEGIGVGAAALPPPPPPPRVAAAASVPKKKTSPAPSLTSRQVDKLSTQGWLPSHLGHGEARPAIHSKSSCIYCCVIILC